MLLGGLGLAESCVVTFSKIETQFVLQFFKLRDFMEDFIGSLLQEYLAGIISKESKIVMKPWSQIATGFKCGTGVGEDYKFSNQILSSKILQAAIWDMNMIMLHIPLARSRNNLSLFSVENFDEVLVNLEV